MLDMFTRGLLERKYAGMEEENRIRQQQATSAGLVAAAQANSLNVSAGLAPRLADSEIGERDVQTQGLRLGLPFIQQKAQADLDATASGIQVNNANIKRIGAETALTGTQRKNLMDSFRTTGIRMLDIDSLIRSRAGLGGGLR
jgi:hypothetical protein